MANKRTPINRHNNSGQENLPNLPSNNTYPPPSLPLCNNRQNHSHSNNFSPNLPPYCSYCRKRGHKEESCYRRRNCTYCHRRGHQINECQSRLQEERQEIFFKNLIQEQRQNNNLLVSSIQRYLTPAFSNVPTTASGITQGYSPTVYPAYSYSSKPNQSYQTNQLINHGQ